MKYLLYVILLVAILMTAGCVNEDKNTVITLTQTIGITLFPTTPVNKGIGQSNTNIQMIGSVYGLASNPSAGIIYCNFFKKIIYLK